MAKLITDAQIKKAIKDCERDECAEIILEIARSCPQAREFLTFKFTGDNNSILEEYKKKVRYEFYPPRGYGRLNLREAKKAISDFKKICLDKSMAIEIMLFYVENCVEYTNDYGDIDMTFYNSAISVYGQVINAVNVAGEDVYKKFARRLEAVITNTSGIGWGFPDGLAEMYNNLVWN